MPDPLDQERRLLRSFFALPQCERDDFLREIEVASLRWRAPAPELISPTDPTYRADADPLLITLNLIEKVREMAPPPMPVRRNRAKKRPR